MLKKIFTKVDEIMYLITMNIYFPLVTSIVAAIAIALLLFT